MPTLLSVVGLTKKNKKQINRNLPRASQQYALLVQGDVCLVLLPKATAKLASIRIYVLQVSWPIQDHTKSRILTCSKLSTSS